MQVISEAKRVLKDIERLSKILGFELSSLDSINICFNMDEE